MSNPYRRPMRERVYKPLEFRSLTGEDVAEHYAELWQFALDDTGGVSESFSDIALRLRHGARAACKRLREERDEARQHFAEERETALEIRDEQRAAERERDAARSRGQDALARAENAERERDEARKELDRARASLEVVRHDLAGTRQELREAREARDSLRSRLIAAESAAAARPPRESPLAEGSPPPSIDPERLDLVRRALSGYVDPDQSPEQAARVAVEVADAALAIMRGLV